MRRWLGCLMLLLTIMSAPARADTLATYRTGTGALIHLYLADDGAARVVVLNPRGSTDSSMLVTKEAEIYVSFGAGPGQMTVRTDDLARAFRANPPPFIIGLGRAPGWIQDAELLAAGSEQVGDWSGRVYRQDVRAPGTDRDRLMSDIVISDDPRLARIGSAVRRVLGAMFGLVPEQVVLPRAIRQLPDLLATGTLIRMQSTRLISVNEVPPDLARYQLSGPAMSSELVQRVFQRQTSPSVSPRVAKR